MDSKTIVQIIFIVGLITVGWWLFRLALKFFIPLVLIGGGIFIYYKYFKEKE